MLGGALGSPVGIDDGILLGNDVGGPLGSSDGA